MPATLDICGEVQNVQDSPSQQYVMDRTSLWALLGNRSASSACVLPPFDVILRDAGRDEQWEERDLTIISVSAQQNVFRKRKRRACLRLNTRNYVGLGGGEKETKKKMACQDLSSRSRSSLGTLQHVAKTLPESGRLLTTAHDIVR